MVEYSYSKIKIINDEGITFKDGTKILFEECRRNWAKVKKLDINDTHCVAERNISSSEPYYIFYSNKKVKIVFDSMFFLCKKKNFMNLQIKLNRLGYSSFDLS
jgi:hypothetical protein